MRAYFFGADGSTLPEREQLERELTGYRHVDLDIRDRDGVLRAVPQAAAREIALVIHTRRPAVARLGRDASRSPTSTSTPAAR